LNPEGGFKHSPAGSLQGRSRCLPELSEVTCPFCWPSRRLDNPLSHIVVEAPGGGPICGPHDVRLYVSGPDRIPTPCFIQDIRPAGPDASKRP
jgi:hypothetical protein